MPLSVTESKCGKCLEAKKPPIQMSCKDNVKRGQPIRIWSLPRHTLPRMQYVILHD